MLNKAILIGHVGSDPELGTFQNGDEYANFSLATSESWKDKNTGEKRERTEWHRISVVSPPLVKVVKNYVKKGSRLYIEGKMTTRKWTDKNGVERYTTSVVLSGFNAKMILTDSKGNGERAPAEPDMPEEPQPDENSDVPF